LHPYKTLILRLGELLILSPGKDGRLYFCSLKMPERVTIRQESVEGERASFFAGTESRTRCETARQWMEFTPERLGDISPARLPR
jgi:hypothetical protein